MHDEVYADAVGDLTVTGGIVRLDLVSLSPGAQADDKQSNLVFRQRVVLPLEGFLRSYGLMTQLVEKLSRDGVVQRRDEPVSPTSPSQDQTRKSPNFN